MVVENKKTHTFKVGNYEIGRYHSIVKRGYSDGTFDYETFFRNRSDQYRYICKLRSSLLELVIFSDSPKVLTSISVIRGKDNIIAELGGAVK